MPCDLCCQNCSLRADNVACAPQDQQRLIRELERLYQIELDAYALRDFYELTDLEATA